MWYNKYTEKCFPNFQKGGVIYVFDSETADKTSFKRRL